VVPKEQQFIGGNENHNGSLFEIIYIIGRMKTITIACVK